MKPRPYLCVGLARFLGALLAVIIFLLVLDYFNRIWFLRLEIEKGLNWEDAQTKIALVGAFIAATIAFLIGQGVGFEIKIRDDEWSSVINIVWSYFAVTAIVWIPAVFLGASLSLGEGRVIFFKEGTFAFFSTAVLITLIGSGTLVRTMMIKEQFDNVGWKKWSYFYTYFLLIIIGVTMGLIQFNAYHLNTVVGLIIGIVTPFVVIPLAFASWKRKNWERNMWPRPK